MRTVYSVRDLFDAAGVTQPESQATTQKPVPNLVEGLEEKLGKAQVLYQQLLAQLPSDFARQSEYPERTVGIPVKLSRDILDTRATIRELQLDIMRAQKGEKSEDRFRHRSTLCRLPR